MTVLEFTDTLLPQLLQYYIEGEIPFHGLVDLDLWRQLFPDAHDAAAASTPTAADQFAWHNVRIAGHPLPDGTLLITYTLPQPEAKGEPKYVAIRIDRCHAERQAVLYTLRRPAGPRDLWDVHYLPLPNAQQLTEQRFRCKVEGADTLRNLVLTVQQLSLHDSLYDKTWLSRLKSFIGAALTPQPDEPILRHQTIAASR